MDLKSYGRWYDYSRARDAMIMATDTEWAPWFLAHSDDKRRARLNIITHLLSRVPFEPQPPMQVKLPRRQPPKGLRRAGLPVHVHPDAVLNQPGHVSTPSRSPQPDPVVRPRPDGDHVVPAGLAGQGRRRRPRAVRAARAAGHGLRRAGRAAAGHRPVHLDPLPARVRGLRAVAGPRARPGLLARADDRRHHRARCCSPAATRPGPSRWPRCSALLVGRRHDGRGARHVRLRRRPALQADPDRLHERPGADHRRRPAAQAASASRSTPTASSREAQAFVSGVADGVANATAAVIGVASLVGILLLQRLLPKLPAVLVVVVLAALAVNLLDLEPTTASTPSACCRRASRR